MPEANPWGLTPRQAEVMDAIIETGCHKLAARRLGVEVVTVETHTQKAREKIGTEGRLLHMLVWDRWRRGAASPSSSSVSLRMTNVDVCGLMVAL